MRLTPVLALFLVACASAPPPAAPPPPPPAPPPIVVAPPPPPPPAPPPKTPAELAVGTNQALFAALAAHDPGALASLYAANASVYVGLGLAEAHGPDAVATLAGAIFTAFPDTKVQWGTLLEAGNAVAVEFAWTGMNTGLLGDRAPTKKVLGMKGLLVLRLDKEGRITAQHLYFDADALKTDLATHGKPHAFAGLPTTQTTVLGDAVATGADDAAMRALAESFLHGSFSDANPLATATSTWTDATKAHVATGKTAITSWVSFLAHAFPGGGKQLLDVWSAGEFLVLEWSASSGSAPDASVTHAADLVKFDAGHIAEVRTYRNVPTKAGKR